MTEFKISKKLALPDTAMTETIAILAQKGFGKTYTAMKLAEQMIKAKGTVVALDPVGNWWSLRLAADGKARWSDVPIFGGLHADFPLPPEKGAFLADVICDHMTSAVLDVSTMNESEKKRFVAEFATRLKTRKANAREGVIHLFLEEAQEFVPQRPAPDEMKMLGALVKIAKLGRNWGIGLTMISQRPQAVSKEALNLASMLIVGCMIAKLDRKAIEDWVDEQGKQDEAEEHLDRLPKLQKGEMVVWSPSWLDILDVVNIAPKETFDASATPRLGQKLKHQEPKPIDAAALRAAMAETEEKIKGEDPKELQKQVKVLNQESFTLKNQVLHLKKQNEELLTRVKEDTDESILSKEDKKGLERALQYSTLITGYLGALAEKLSKKPTPVKTKSRMLVQQVEEKKEAKNLETKQMKSNGKFGGKELSILQFLAGAYPKGWSMKQIGILIDMSTKGGAFRNYVSHLRTSGLLQSEGEMYYATEEGVDYIKSQRAVPKWADAEDFFTLFSSSKRFSGKAKEMLRILKDSPGKAFSVSEIAELVEMDEGGGAFRNYVSMLRSSGVLDPTVKKALKANPEMFGG